MIQRGALFSILLLTPSCLTISQRMVDVDRPLVTTDSGVVYEDLLPGLGDSPEHGRPLVIDYVCTLEDGTFVDSTYQRGQAVEFVFGEAWLPGLDEGLEGMRTGGKRRMTLPADVAYGPDGVEGLVPPGAPLVFEVELVSVGTPGSPEPSGERSG